MDVVERCDTPRGELVLRRDGAHFEIIADGVFLMDTRGGTSERLLVRAALAAAVRTRSVLIGGLGVGFSLHEAVRCPALDRIVVVEVEEAVLRWQRTHLAHVTGSAARDPRVALVHADLLDWLPACRERFDAVCLDVDNGPAWTVTPRNAWLYSTAGLTTLASVLAPGGSVAVWSAHAAARFRDRLDATFTDVDEHAVPAPRGEPDRVYVARAPRQGSAGSGPAARCDG